jgi:adenosylhomocysteine nucleosidase
VERVAIFAALRWECSPVLRRMRGIRKSRVAHSTLWRGETAEREVWLIKTAVGEQRAGAAAQSVCGATRFDLLLSTGCAGALSPDMRPGDLTIATAVIGNSSGTRFETDPEHREGARAAAERAALRTIIGPLLCSPHVLATGAAKREAAASTGSVAVEMEGAAIAAFAHDAGIPFAAVRAILDSAETELPAAAGLVDHHTGGVNVRNVIRHLAFHPGALSQMLALQRMQSAAQRSLERFFQAWLAGDEDAPRRHR